MKTMLKRHASQLVSFFHETEKSKRESEERANSLRLFVFGAMKAETRLITRKKSFLPRKHYWKVKHFLMEHRVCKRGLYRLWMKILISLRSLFKTVSFQSDNVTLDLNKFFVLQCGIFIHGESNKMYFKNT